MKTDAKKQSKFRKLINSFQSNTIIIISIIFFIVTICLLVLGIFEILDFSHISTGLTVIASLLLAICSILNILILLKQEAAHQEQIKELELSRKMLDRPMPCVRDAKLKIENPTLYSPVCHENRCKFFSRYHIEIELENISDYPIPFLFASVFLKCLEDTEIYDGMYFSSDYKSGIPSHAKKQKLSLMHANDIDGKFYDSLRYEYPQEYSQLRIYLYFKSFSGGCFLLTQDYWVLPPEDADEKTIIDWQTAITCIKTKYANMFNDYTFYHEQGDEDKANEIYEKLSQIIKKENLSTEKTTIKLCEIPGKLKIVTLTEEKFNEYTTRINTSHLCGKKPGCLYNNKNKKSE